MCHAEIYGYTSHRLTFVVEPREAPQVPDDKLEDPKLLELVAMVMNVWGTEAGKSSYLKVTSQRVRRRTSMFEYGELGASRG